MDGTLILKIHVPRARRKDKPVYIGDSPLKGTYIRRHEGDYILKPEAVMQMLSEKSEESADSIIIPRYNLDDIDIETLQSYRTTLANRNPNHPFLLEDNINFLRQIGGWKRDRENNNEGLTIAGLVMFGKFRSILDYLENFILDYQEQPKNQPEKRWIDRITTDGTWSGNIYTFYKKVYPKLTADLKVPFLLEKGMRIDETPAHEALREALVNSLIHADYRHGRISVNIIKSPDIFYFRNPGMMRVSIEDAIQGGNSDCRNRNLQKMFQLVGAGEQAGSGVPKIITNWEKQQWRRPKISEKQDPAQSIFELHMMSFLPPNIESELENILGSNFPKLDTLEKQILSTAYTEGDVNHKRMKELTDTHSSDISKAFSTLAKDGFLKTKGSGRGMIYTLQEQKNKSTGLRTNSTDLKENSTDLKENSTDLKENSTDLKENLVMLSLAEREAIENILDKKSVPRHTMTEAIINLCKIKPYTVEELGKILKRKPQYIRENYLKGLIKTDLLFYTKDTINDPKQSYTTYKKKK